MDEREIIARLEVLSRLANRGNIELGGLSREWMGIRLELDEIIRDLTIHKHQPSKKKWWKVWQR